MFILLYLFVSRVIPSIYFYYKFLFNTDNVHSIIRRFSPS